MVASLGLRPKGALCSDVVGKFAAVVAPGKKKKYLLDADNFGESMMDVKHLFCNNSNI